MRTLTSAAAKVQVTGSCKMQVTLAIYPTRKRGYMPSMNLKVFRDDKSITWSGRDDAHSHQYAIIRLLCSYFVTDWVLCVLQHFSRKPLR